MTITEKIIAAHAGAHAVEPGEYVTVKVDVVMGNDRSTAGAIGVLRAMEARRVFDPARIVVVLDHVAPARQGLVRKEGLLEIFSDAGAAVSTPTCGACFGGHMGILGKNEVCLSTTNRNFVGRMGDPTAESYLANPAVAAASAIKGEIAAPEEVA